MKKDEGPRFGPPSFVEIFEKVLVPAIFRPWAEDLVDRSPPTASERIFDVACGTGIVARVARARVGAATRIAGADLQPAMIAMARAVAPDIEWHEADALALPFEEGAFDRVFCQQGLQFFADRAAGLREMRRVLAPGGHVAISTWRALDEQPFLAAIHRAASRHVEVPPDRRLSLGDAGELASLLESAGFRSVRVETVARTERYDDAAQIVRLHTTAIVPGFSTMDSAERDRLADAVLDEMKDTIERHADGTGVAYEMRANIAIARA